MDFVISTHDLSDPEYVAIIFQEVANNGDLESV